MDKYVVLFIKTSILSFIIASGLGMEIAIKPSHASYFINAHVHLNLLGFMAMMIFGVGYHVLPRFSGLAIHSRNLLVTHYYLGASTLAVMSLCWIGMEMTPYVDATRIGLIFSGTGHLLSIFLFAYNIFRSIKPVAPPQIQPQNN